MPCVTYVDTDCLQEILLNFGYMVLVNFSSFVSFLSKFRISLISQNVFKEDHH